MKVWQCAARMVGAMVIAVGLFGQTVWAEEGLLDKDTHFYLQGHMVGEEIEFKGGTTVILNALGEAVEGTLGEEAWLRPVGWQAIIQDYSYAAAYLDARPFFPRMSNSSHQAVMMTFGHLPYKEKTRIVLDEKGYVVSGTVKEDVTIGLTEDRYGFVTLKGGDEIVFYPDGKLRAGTLKENTNLRPVGWQKYVANDMASAGYAAFRAGESIVFNEQGEVLIGTLDKASPMLTDAAGRVYPAGSKLSFGEEGITEMAKAVVLQKPLKFGF